MAYKCPSCQHAIEDAIPKDRFDEINNERKAFKSQLDEVQKNGKSAEALAQKLQSVEQELVNTKIGYTIDLTLRDAKIDDAETRTSIREVMEWQHSKLPADNRPPLDEAAKLWLTEPDKAPAPVRSLLPKPPPPEQEKPAQGQQQAAGQQAAPRPGFVRHTKGLEGSGSNTGYQVGSLRAKREAGTLTQADIDAARAAVSGAPAKPTTP